MISENTRRNIGIALWVLLATMMAFNLFFGWSMFFGLDITSSILVGVMFASPVSLLVLAWALNWIPHYINDALKVLLIPVLGIISILIMIIVLPEWLNSVHEYLTTFNVNYADSLVIASGVSLLFSWILVIYRASRWKQPAKSDINLDLHSKICRITNVDYRAEPSPDLREEYGYSSMRSDPHSTERILELITGFLVSSIVVSFFMFAAGVLGTESRSASRQAFGFIQMGVFMSTFMLIAFEGHYLVWKDFWTKYWEFIRVVSLPAYRIIESVPLPPKPYGRIFAGMTSDSFGFTYDPQYIDLIDTAENLNLQLTDHPTAEEAKWVYQIRDIRREINELAEHEFMNNDYMRAFTIALEHSPNEFQLDLFNRQIRYSHLLKIAPIYLRYPRVISDISSLPSWIIEVEDSIEHNEIFDLASSQLQSIYELPTIPIPGSVKFVVAAVGLILALLPYLFELLKLLS